MMKTLTLLAVAVLAPMLAAEESPKLPPAIQAIVEKAEAEVSKNRKVYDAANSKSLDAAEKALKAELEKMTKAGKLEEAMAAKKMLESVRADVVTRVDEQAAKGGGDLLGDKPKTEKTTAKLLTGKWKQNNGAVYEFVKSGALLCWWNGANHEAGKPHEAAGTWSCDAKSASFDLAGRHYTINGGSEADMSLTDVSGGGVPYTMTKINPGESQSK
jgi:hypothetical protein